MRQHKQLTLNQTILENKEADLSSVGFFFDWTDSGD
jgi:hypothetical protein